MEEPTVQSTPILPSNDQIQGLSLIKKSLVVTIFFVLLLVVITFLVLGGLAYAQLVKIATAAQTTPTALVELVKTGWQTEITQTQDKKNILILGIDQLENRAGDPVLTDTILLASLTVSTGELHLLSLPRDLWIPDYLTKINSLYFYGQERYPSKPEQFTTEVVAELAGIPIHHTIVLSLEQVAELVDLLGGIEVSVENGFTDPLFPRSDVDIKTVTDPELLYETVVFEPGTQTMTGEKALQYIRSRHSGDDQGTDNARGLRQQQLLSALVDKLLSRSVVSDPQKLGQLLHFYQQNFETALPSGQGIALVKNFVKQRDQLNLEINKDTLSIKTGTQSGVITHPPITQTQNQWSYVIVDQADFLQEVQEKLGIVPSN